MIILFEFSPHSVIFFIFKFKFCGGGCCRNWCILRLMWFTVNISVKTFIPIFNVSVKYKRIFGRLATSEVWTNAFCPPDSSRPDGERRHGLHSGQRQTRRAVRNASQPADEERLLHCHVSSGGPEVLIEDPLPKRGAQEGGWGSSTWVLHYHGWGLTYTVGSFSLILGGWGG